MKIRLVIDPEWRYGWYVNKNNNPDWGKWDMLVEGRKFFGTQHNVWCSFIKVVQGMDLDKACGTHNQEDTPHANQD